MKSPMNQRPDNEAREKTEAFIAEHTIKNEAAPKSSTKATA
jgi:hypothetical protein